MLLKRVLEKGYTRKSLAVAAGLSPGTLRAAPMDGGAELEASDFNPTAKTINRLENLLLSDTQTMNQTVKHKNILGKSYIDTGESLNYKIYLKFELAFSIAPQVRLTCLYLNSILRMLGVLDIDRVDFSFLNDLGPDCAFHIVEATGSPEECRFVRWHLVSNYRDGRDFTGMPVIGAEVGGLNQCMAADFEACRSSTTPQFAALTRHSVWSIYRVVDRSFLRV